MKFLISKSIKTKFLVRSSAQGHRERRKHWFKTSRRIVEIHFPGKKSQLLVEDSIWIYRCHYAEWCKQNGKLSRSVYPALPMTFSLTLSPKPWEWGIAMTDFFLLTQSNWLKSWAGSSGGEWAECWIDSQTIAVDRRSRQITWMSQLWLRCHQLDLKN